MQVVVDLKSGENGDGNVFSAKRDANFKNANFETLILYKTFPINCKEFLRSF